MSDQVKAHPTKDFFVRMITRDISLEDCVMDLLDNCLDGASKDLQRKGQHALDARRYDNYSANITVNSDEFSISDNCGGIDLNEAINYAFHFGRRPDSPQDADYSIGLYGIGMKRAIFKIGNSVDIQSSTADEAFSISIDVEQWAKEEDWNFNLDRLAPNAPAGTHIRVRDLKSSVSNEFGDSVFVNTLVKIVARDYSFFLQKGFAVTINDQPVRPYAFALRESAEFEPVKFSYESSSGVMVDVYAGLSGLPSDDSSAEATQPKEAEYFGWFVACNDRIVIAGDKSKNTVWGNDGFNVWHPQYNGFMGVVNFKSSDSSLLPWTTTKREIELDDPLYKQALVHMKDVTKKYINYTNSRKQDMDKAKELEHQSVSRPISELPSRVRIKLPEFSPRPRVDMANIQYAVERERVRKVAAALGNRSMALKKVGEKTFAYYYENEIGD